MADIYYDIYITDQLIKGERSFKRMSDTSLVYEPIFNRYGYTTADYNASVQHYLERPDKFSKLLKEVQNRLEVRKVHLERELAEEQKRMFRWAFADSLEAYTADSIQSSGYYRTLRMIFFKPDTLVPSSPLPDTAFMERPQNIFTIFSDSLYRADENFRFYTTLGISLPDTVAASDTLETKMIPVIENKPKNKKNNKPGQRDSWWSPSESHSALRPAPAAYRERNGKKDTTKRGK